MSRKQDSIRNHEHVHGMHVVAFCRLCLKQNRPFVDRVPILPSEYYACAVANTPTSHQMLDVSTGAWGTVAAHQTNDGPKVRATVNQ